MTYFASKLSTLFKTTALITVIVSLSACTKNKKDEYGLDMRETLRINIQTEPPSLDWSKSTDTTSAWIEVNIMEGLTEYNLNDPELGLVPALAVSWDPAEGGKKWTFKLRPGVKWTDDVELVAQHFVDGWERLLNPNTASEYAYFLFGVKNAKAYNEGKIKDFAEVGVKATDEHTLVVELDQATSFFPYLMTHHATYPLRKDVVEKHGDRWTDPGNIQTLGAYTLKVWEHDKAIVLERNMNYYGEKAKIKNILAYMINESSTALNLFESGKLDAQHEIPSVELAKYSKYPEYRKTSSLVLQYYGFNTKKKPFDDVRVRKAIAYAIDKGEIVQILNGGQTPLTSWVPPGMFGYEKERGVKYDPEKAKELLAQAGYGEKKKFPKVTIALNTNEDHKRVAENVQAQLKRNLGIDVEIQNEEWKVYLSRLKADPPSIFRMGWAADYPDPDNFLNLLTSYSDNNRTLWKNKKYDKLIEQAVSELDKEKRRSIYSQAQQLLVEDEVPAVPLFSSVSHQLISNRVENYPLNPMGRYIYKNVTLKQ